MKKDPVRASIFLILAMLVAVASFTQIRSTFLPYDDAFITFRYVANVAQGKGLVYNDGARVFGSSTPLYVLWLSGLHLLVPWAAIPGLALGSNVLFFGAAGILFFLLVAALTESRWMALGGAAAFLLNPVMLASSAGGMESSLFVFLTLAALLSATTRRDLLTGSLLGLATLARPEGILACFVVALARTDGRERLARLVAGWAAPVVMWAGFALLYNGSPVPHSIVAKARPLYPLPPGTGLGKVIQWTGDWLTGSPGPQAGAVPKVTLAVAAMLGATLACIGGRRGRDLNAWQVPLLYWLFLAFFWVTNPLAFDWYWPPVFVAALMTVVTAVAVLIRIAGSMTGRRARQATVVTLGIVFGGWLFLSTFAPYGKTQGVWEPLSVTRVAEDPIRLRILAYEKAAEALNAVSRKGETVAASEIGSFGYYFKGKIFDACGLVTPEALPFLPVPPEKRVGPEVGAISEEFVRAVSPDWVVTMPVFAKRSLSNSAWFRQEYRLAMAVPLPRKCWGDKEVLVFRREAVPAVVPE